MKTMTIEKQLVLSKKASNVLRLEIQEHLVYRKEDSGIRAVGQLFVQGLYEDDYQEQIKLQEVLEMDVLAPWEKLVNDKFALKVFEYHADIENGDIILYITLHVHGLKEDTVQEQASNSVEHMETDEIQEEENSVQSQEAFEDLFEDTNTTYTSYRMVVAQPQDTYESIASRYQVDINELRSRNHNRTLETKMLVILPPTNEA